MEKEFELFIPDVKTYGCVFIIDDEPILFILTDDNKIIDGVPITNDFEEEDEDIYLLLDDNEMILVSVEIFDINFKELSSDDITDDNYDELIYNLKPLKIHTIESKGLDMLDIYNSGLLEDLMVEVTSKYKKVLSKI